MGFLAALHYLFAVFFLLFSGGCASFVCFCPKNAIQFSSNSFAIGQFGVSLLEIHLAKNVKPPGSCQAFGSCPDEVKETEVKETELRKSLGK